MKVVILCGGQGTRIRDASELLPKPMLPIGGRPIVWHIMKQYSHFGFDEFVLCLGYKGWLIKEYFLNYRAMHDDLCVDLRAGGAVSLLGASATHEPWRVTLAETGELSMTGGRVGAVRRYVEHDDLFLLTYGDGVSDVDLGALVAFHRSHGRVLTVTAVHPPGRFGELAIEGTSVRSFNEKPQTTEGYINGGFMVCDAKRIWPYLGHDPMTLFEKEPMQRLAQEDELRAYVHEGFWQPMDTLREYQLLNELWANGRAPWRWPEHAR
ncbi:MAG: glucose-1-phosphate cytidylyltransferase [Myxococcales bacterium]|nr:glucose-1-phosphate cytidylyltransferase [Myxococcales bacterium]